MSRACFSTQEEKTSVTEYTLRIDQSISMVDLNISSNIILSLNFFVVVRQKCEFLCIHSSGSMSHHIMIMTSICTQD